MPPRYSAYGWAQPAAGRAGSDPARDRSALSQVRLASILALVGGIVGFVALAVVNAAQLVTVTQRTPGSGGPTISLGVPGLLALYLGVVTAVTIVELLLLRFAFHTLSEVDREFSTPSTLTILALIGLPLAIAGVALVLVALVQDLSCINSSTLSGASCISGDFWAGLGLALLGGVLALVGYIGILIGIWRLGTRYDNVLFKVGAILTIIPYASIVGQILILVAATQEIGKLPRTAAA